jgi:heat shock protein HslJ
MGGSDGCNRFGGTYLVNGDKLKFDKNIVKTLMGCQQDILKQGDDFTTALTQTAAFRNDGQTLTLLDGFGKTLATFTAQSTKLGGTQWVVTGYNNGKQAVVSVIIGSELTADFSADGTLSGSAGCNNYTATYAASGKSIKIGPAASTRKMCADPAGVMEQETQFLKALETAATYHIDGNQLELRTTDGALAVTCTRTLPKELPSNEAAPGRDPENATYLIEGEAITLVKGIAEKELTPGSASKQATRYFGNAVEIDLNSDGLMDSAFLLVQGSGGSGTFYYVVAALKTAGGYWGTNAIFLGDRIAPQLTFIDPDNPSRFVVSYGERRADEPMSSKPTQMVSRTFRIDDGLLVEVVTPSTQTP